MAKVYQFPQGKNRQMMKKTFRITKRKMLFKKIFSLMGRIFFWLFIWSRRIVASVLHMSVYFSLSLLHVFRYFLFLLGGFYCLIHYNQIHGWYTVDDYSVVIVAICIIASLVAEGLVSWLDNASPFHRLLFVRKNRYVETQGER